MDEISGLESLQGQKIVLFPIASRPALEPMQPLKQWESGVFPLGPKRQGHESDYSPPSDAEVMSIDGPPVPHTPS
jgi:hypothetical protein